MSRFAIGVDLGGTNLRIAAIEESGRLLEKVSFSVRALAGRDEVIEELCRAVRDLSGKYEEHASLAAVGVGVPGIIYVQTGMLRQSPNLPGWENFPVRDAIASRLGGRTGAPGEAPGEVNVLLDNDANLAALGEKWLGAGRDVTSLCLLTLGTGVGGGLIFDGKIWRGFLGMAGEVGHIVVAENGVHCGCGGSGCLETEASATAIVRKAEQLLASSRSPALVEAKQRESSLTAHLVYQVAKDGDPACREILESFGRYLGLGLAGLVNLLNLPLYVIGGGVVEAWDLFAPAMFAELRRRSYIFAEGSTRIERSLLGGDAGLYGAARLAFQAPA